MTLKIVKNITLSAEGRERLFLKHNTSQEEVMIVVLFNAHSIKGDFLAYSKLKYVSGAPRSSLDFLAWGDSVDDISRFTNGNWSKDEQGKPIYNRLRPFPPPYEELTDDWVDTPIQIPPETQFITICIAQGDTVEIKASMKEEYAIIDVAGIEIPLERFVLRD